MLRGTVITVGLILLIATATTAAAQEAAFAGAPLARAARSLFDVAPPTFVYESAAPSAARQPQTPAPQAPAPQTPATTTTSTDANGHQFGAGLRAGGAAFGLGGSIRYFFYGGALGVQAEVAHYALELGPEEWSAIQFAPSAIYRFPDQKFAGPAHLTPYVGAGLSFVHSFFPDVPDEIDELLTPDETTVGVLFYGGMELFFDKFPNLGFSGELSFISNHEDLNAQTGSLPWPSFIAAAHWYFW